MTNATIEATTCYMFQVDFVDFDFESDFHEVTQEDKDEAIQSVLFKTFVVEHEELVTDFISDYTGWLVDSMSYHQVN